MTGVQSRNSKGLCFYYAPFPTSQGRAGGRERIGKLALAAVGECDGIGMAPWVEVAGEYFLLMTHNL